MPIFLSVADDETDALFRTDPLALAERFGERTKRQMADGRDPFMAARLAATYAFMYRPDLRGEKPKGPFGQTLYQIGTELNRLFYADMLKPTVH